jgi:signal transduction histidine kinase
MTTTQHAQANPMHLAATAGDDLFAGPGEMRALCRAFDWASSPLGPVRTWPLSLRTTVKTLLASRQPMLLFWGPELVQFYNDDFRPSLGAGGRHPHGLGARAREFWSDVWSIVGHELEQVVRHGVATWHEDALVPIERNGRIDEVYWTYSYGPAYDDGGSVAGVLVVCQETTSRVLASRENEQLLDALATANAQLEDRARDLSRANRQLQDTAAQLEMQTEELQATSSELAERTDVAERAMAEAEAANRSKSDFLAVMSHELRTPLNAIGGYAELMQLGIRGALTDEQRTDLARIQQSQKHLLGLINQVLNYARIETGLVQYDVTDVSVSDALAAAEALIEPQVRAKGLAYALGACGPGVTVRADREKLQQILLNLLTNAIKFTSAGGRITVSCDVSPRSVAIAVRDTGVGIADDKLAMVFEPFVQVDAKLTRRQEGVGLGLAISRDLARGMRGDLTAASVLDVGSTFTLTLPRLSEPPSSA